MSLNDTPSGERAHIVFFGVRNAGKSSLVNALTSQTVSVVSDVAGTTTDPVRKAMELAPAGPVLIVDTPGIDDAGDVGDLRVQRAEAALNEADVAVLVMDATCGMTSFDDRLPRHLPNAPHPPRHRRKQGRPACGKRACWRRRAVVVFAVLGGRRFEWQSPLGRRRLQRRGLRRKRRRFRTGRPRARVGADGGGSGRPEARRRHPGCGRGGGAAARGRLARAR